MNHKLPDLNIRYAAGLGDIIASILHSKMFSWLVKIITKKDAPCSSCSQRRYALNILFPIKIWKLFFKDYETYLENLKNYYIKCGYNASLSEDGSHLKISKFEEFKTEEIENPENTKTQKLKNVPKKDGYLFLSSNEIFLDDHVIRTEYFKKL